MKRIKAYSKVSGNKYVKVSDEDYEEVSKHSWTVAKSRRKFYALTKINGKLIRMHRFIMKPKSTHEVDHINDDGLDNRRENLRVVTRLQNQRNKTKYSNKKQRYKGIYYDSRIKKWVAVINYRRKKKYLGNYKLAKDAARAYNEAAIKYYKNFANLNKIT